MAVTETVTKAFRSRIFVTQVFTILVLLTMLFSTEGWEGKGYILIEESLYFAGVVLVALCAAGRAWSLSYISGSKERRLITSGPYSLCRNPLYFSNFLGAVGLGLCTETLTITLAVLLAFFAYYPKVVLREEKRLLELFGDEFESYCQKVPALFPSFKSFVEDETILISARSFRNGIRDLGTLILAVGLIEFVEALHKAEVLPTLFVLY